MQVKNSSTECLGFHIVSEYVAKTQNNTDESYLPIYRLYMKAIFKVALTSPTIPRHIRDLNVYPARKFKFNKDNRRTDNRENDLKTPNSVCILRDYELTGYISYELAYGFYRRYINVMNETFLKFLPLVKLVRNFSQSLSISVFSLYEKTQWKHFEAEFFSNLT